MKYFIAILLILTIAVGMYIVSLPVAGAELKDITLHVHYLDNVTQMPKNAMTYNGQRQLGYAEVSKKSGVTECHVYVVKPRNRNDFWRMEILGHEVMHCTDGDYHK